MEKQPYSRIKDIVPIRRSMFADDPLPVIGLLLFLAVFFGSCQRGGDLGYVDYEPLVAVEGKIESGGFAFVLLTWTSSFNHELDTLYLLEHVIKSAKVSVSNGRETEILTLGRRPGFIPPYAYYGSQITGVPGEKYTLEIVYQNRIISAETIIPEPATLDDYWFEKKAPEDTIGYVHIRFTDDPSQQRYYQVATQVEGKEKVFTPCLFGTMDNTQFEGKKDISLQINKGPSIYPKTSFESYFVTGNDVQIQFRTLPEEGYRFWNSWQEEILNAQNPIFPARSDLQSNINGGIGIWCGYGVSNYRLRLE